MVKITDTSDYSRFARTRRAAFVGTGLGYFIPHVWFYALGATLVLTDTNRDRAWAGGQTGLPPARCRCHD